MEREADQGDPVGAARAAGLRYVSDAIPGILRRRAGKAFSYRGPDGQLIKEQAELVRIRRLAIPPAWTGVWICRHANGHLQATGRDARGRKQYRYHPEWRAVRDAAKFDRMLAFGQPCRGSGRGSRRTRPAGGCRARRCWRPWSACSRSP